MKDEQHQAQEMVQEQAQDQQDSGFALPDTSILVMFILIVGVLAWGVVAIVKALGQGWVEQSQGKHPWWWQGGLRLLAVIVGLWAGTSLWGAALGNDGWPWGTCLGGGAGGMSAYIVWLARKRLAAAVGPQGAQPPESSTPASQAAPDADDGGP